MYSIALGRSSSPSDCFRVQSLLSWRFVTVGRGKPNLPTFSAPNGTLSRSSAVAFVLADTLVPGLGGLGRVGGCKGMSFSESSNAPKPTYHCQHWCHDRTGLASKRRHRSDDGRRVRRGGTSVRAKTVSVEEQMHVHWCWSRSRGLVWTRYSRDSR